MAPCDITEIGRRLGLDVPRSFAGVDAVLPILERMREDGAVVLIKFDGERVRPGDTGPYTVLASGRPLGDEALRTDATTLEAALRLVIERYAARVWGWK